MMNAHPDTSEDIRDLYRELILDHAKSPRNFGRLEDPTHTAEGINPLCGDKLRLYLQVSDDHIAKARFEGSGCAISMASASMMTDVVQGLSKSRALAHFEAVRERLTGTDGAINDASLDLGKLQALEGVRDYPMRVKCATLAWHALDSALRGQMMPVSTE